MKAALSKLHLEVYIRATVLEYTTNHYSSTLYEAQRRIMLCTCTKSRGPISNKGVERGLSFSDFVGHAEHHLAADALKYGRMVHKYDFTNTINSW